MDNDSNTIPTTPAPPRRSFGLLWAGIAIAVLAVLMFSMDDSESGPERDKRLLQEQEFLDAYSLRDRVITRPSGLMIRHLEEGSGEQPDSGSMVTVHYEGRLVNGTVFDSSAQRGKAAVFPLAGVIPGWQEALRMMRVGGQAEVVIPADLAYGERSMGGGAIPANSALVFDVHLLSVD